MPINLQKGQKVSLTKDNPGLSKIVVGLGWDVNAFESLIEGFFSRERSSMHRSLQNSAKAYNFYKSMSSLSAAGNEPSCDYKK